MSLPKIRESLKTCKQTAKCTHINWAYIVIQTLKWIPFSILCGTIIGLVAAGFDIAVVKINNFLISHKTALILFPIIVAITTGILIEKDTSIAGAGINYILNHLKEAAPPIKLIKKTLISILALSGVFIAGREGPSFFIGSSLSLYLSKLFKIDNSLKDRVALIGAGAFTSALLKAPLGGAIFALEIRYTSDMEYEFFPQTLIASIFSYMVFSFFRSKHSLVSISSANISYSIHSLFLLMVLGIVISIMAYIFITIFHLSNCLSGFARPILRPLIGVVFALPFIFIIAKYNSIDLLNASVNYKALSNIANLTLNPYYALIMLFLTMASVSLTIGFGISGGLILPSLIMGALLGNIMATVFGENLTLFALSGMAASLAAVAKTPLAAIVLVLELSQTDLIIPLTASVIVSYIFTYGLSIYTSQKACKLFNEYHEK
ncbi:chloride channel protein [Hippea alviniae]|uniref:chloride channel protein n=1 Tax=Hippea alviniae TaxID=1279027 RepID=UPI0003B6ED04|nr:chloride channel protein [Hippea alviniae]